jgi:hypothetical protein
LRGRIKDRLCRFQYLLKEGVEAVRATDPRSMDTITYAPKPVFEFSKVSVGGKEAGYQHYRLALTSRNPDAAIDGRGP